MRAYECLELPVWRRSGFWTTSLQSLDLDALQTNIDEREVPDVVTRTLPDRPRAGRIVQSAGAVVQVELDETLAERGVLLCSLEQAFAQHGELVSAWYSKRLPIDRNKLEAANAAFWTGGAFLYVPPGVVVEDPFEIVYAIEEPAVAQYGRTLVLGAPMSDFRVHEYDLAEDFDTRAQARANRCTRARSSSTCRTARAAAWRSTRIGARARCSTCPHVSLVSDATRTATGCRRCWGAIWCASIWSWQ